MLPRIIIIALLLLQTTTATVPVSTEDAILRSINRKHVKTNAKPIITYGRSRNGVHTQAVRVQTARYKPRFVTTKVRESDNKEEENTKQHERSGENDQSSAMNSKPQRHKEPVQSNTLRSQTPRIHTSRPRANDLRESEEEEEADEGEHEDGGEIEKPSAMESDDSEIARVKRMKGTEVVTEDLRDLRTEGNSVYANRKTESASHTNAISQPISDNTQTPKPNKHISKIKTYGRNTSGRRQTPISRLFADMAVHEVIISKKMGRKGSANVVSNDSDESEDNQPAPIARRAQHSGVLADAARRGRPKRKFSSAEQADESNDGEGTTAQGLSESHRSSREVPDFTHADGSEHQNAPTNTQGRDVSRGKRKVRNFHNKDNERHNEKRRGLADQNVWEADGLSEAHIDSERKTGGTDRTRLLTTKRNSLLVEQKTAERTAPNYQASLDIDKGEDSDIESHDVDHAVHHSRMLQADSQSHITTAFDSKVAENGIADEQKRCGPEWPSPKLRTASTQVCKSSDVSPHFVASGAQLDWETFRATAVQLNHPIKCYDVDNDKIASMLRTWPFRNLHYDKRSQCIDLWLKQPGKDRTLRRKDEDIPDLAWQSLIDRWDQAMEKSWQYMENDRVFNLRMKDVDMSEAIRESQDFTVGVQGLSDRAESQMQLHHEQRDLPTWKGQENVTRLEEEVSESTERTSPAGLGLGNHELVAACTSNKSLEELAAEALLHLRP